MIPEGILLIVPKKMFWQNSRSIGKASKAIFGWVSGSIRKQISEATLGGLNEGYLGGIRGEIIR